MLVGLYHFFEHKYEDAAAASKAYEAAIAKLDEFEAG